jgi:hypothetical protein
MTAHSFLLDPGNAARGEGRAVGDREVGTDVSTGQWYRAVTSPIADGCDGPVPNLYS